MLLPLIDRPVLLNLKSFSLQ